MQIHASCAARDGAGVLVVGPPACGKSDLVLRLIDRGFLLVADDQVRIDQGRASAPASLAGLIELRGLGILRMEHAVSVQLRLVVRLAAAEAMVRLPEPRRDPRFDLPLIELDPWHVSAAQRVSLALDCATGARAQLAGAFAA